MRIAFLLLACVSLHCRDIHPFEPPSSIAGYFLEGTVTSSNGVPISDVDVKLYYTYKRVGSTPIDTQRVYVTSPTHIVDVAVYTADYKFVRQLFLDYRSPGVVPVYRWDGFDENGVSVRSGKYLIRYVVDTAIVKYSPVIIDGHITTRTDIFGQFTFDTNDLPIGDRFDIYESFSVFYGVYEVEPEIEIGLRKLTVSKRFTSIAVTKDKRTTRTFILE